MPIRKHQKPHSKEFHGALVPQKEAAFPTRRAFGISQTNQIEKPRINALATAGKKKRPK